MVQAIRNSFSLSRQRRSSAGSSAGERWEGEEGMGCQLPRGAQAQLEAPAGRAGGALQGLGVALSGASLASYAVPGCHASCC